MYIFFNLAVVKTIGGLCIKYDNVSDNNETGAITSEVEFYIYFSPSRLWFNFWRLQLVQITYWIVVVFCVPIAKIKVEQRYAVIQNDHPIDIKGISSIVNLSYGSTYVQ